MTRLFIRFYLGVLFILFTAWLVQSYVAEQSSDKENVRVIERALSGGLRAVKDRLDHTDDFDTEFKYVKMGFEYPVELHDPEKFVKMKRLFEPNQLVFFKKYGNRVAIRLEKTDQILVVGPLPTFVGPSRFTQLTGLGVVLLLAAGGIAILLRPVARQLRQVEKAATAIADGDLSARVDTNKVPRGRRLASAFNTMADRTERLLKTQTNLLQAVSHELRTPLSKMRFAIDLVGSAKTDEERQKRLDSLDDATEELNGLVGELLSFAKSEAAAKAGETQAVSLGTLIEKMTESLQESHPHLEFDLEKITSNETFVTAELGGIKRVMSNLISNACKFAKSKVRFNAVVAGEYLTIEVEDDGVGIPEDQRQSVLEPFVRLDDRPDVEDDDGVGLGLALVHRIVLGHGGRVEIRDSTLGGCCVRTLWPIREIKND